MIPVFLGLGLVGFAFWWADQRGMNSEYEGEGESLEGVTLEGRILDSLGWPYFFGRGSPSTPWAEGPEGVDCSGYAQMALVELGRLASSAGDRGATTLANDSDPVDIGAQGVGDLAFYPGHVMVVAGPPGADGHSPVIGASGGGATTFGNDPDARVKAFRTAEYRPDFLTYGRLRTT